MHFDALQPGLQDPFYFLFNVFHGGVDGAEADEAVVGLSLFQKEGIDAMYPVGGVGHRQHNKLLDAGLPANLQYVGDEAYYDCNSLEVAENGEITGFKMRCEQSKLTTVKGLQSIGYETIAAGDSFNDLGMIQASKAGFLFKSTEAIKAAHPELPAFEEFDDLLAAIKKELV